jgi:hypothetical protein
MIDRLRLLLDRPLDPPIARAVGVLAMAVLLGFAAVMVLGASERQDSAPSPESVVRGSAGASIPDASASEGDSSGLRRPQRRRRQDPQDATGSAAARRAAAESRSHRALQHVPYRQGLVAIRLVGARRGRALLRVSAPTIVAARRGWRAFLRRFGDTGRSYVPIFKGGAGTATAAGTAARAGA